MTAEKYNIATALNRALHEEMARDEDVIVLGEDVGENGGVYRITDGLHDAFNEDGDVERVLDTPLDEDGILGFSQGLAMQGKNPVPEIQFSGFMYPAFNQLVSHIPRMPVRTRSKFGSQMTIRAPYGGGVNAPELHSESMESIYQSIPGLKVTMPSTPSDAYGMLKESVRDPDPVLFMEPKRLYREGREEIMEEEYTVPLDEAVVRREGDDVTVACWGTMVPEALEAAEALEEYDIDTEVVDMRSVYPLDMETVRESYRDTGHLVTAEEGPKTGGVGGEIATRIAESDDLFYLETPVGRVAAPDITQPLGANEDKYLPRSDDIVEKVSETVNYEF